MGPADRRQRMGESSTATAEAFLKRTRHWRRVPVWGGSSSECTRFAGAVVCRNSHARGKRADLSPVRYSHQKSPALLTAAVPCNSAQSPPAKPRPVGPHQAGFLVSEPVRLVPLPTATHRPDLTGYVSVRRGLLRNRAQAERPRRDRLPNDRAAAERLRLKIGPEGVGGAAGFLRWATVGGRGGTGAATGATAV